MEKLANTLTSSQTKDLIVQMQNGSSEARILLIKHNERLITYIINRKRYNDNYEMEDLISIGRIGLIKGVDTYDSTKGANLSSYLIHCINNEILMHFRKENKYLTNMSLEDSIYTNQKTDESIPLKDQIASEEDIEEDYAKKELRIVIRKIVEDLPEPKKTIIKLYFGFENDKRYTDREIGNKIGYSQSYISRIKTRTLKEIEEKLNTTNSFKVYQELKGIKPKYQKPKSKVTTRKVKTIYEFFDATKEEIDTVIDSLPTKHKNMILKKYGSDLSNPEYHKLSKEDNLFFYNNVIGIIKRRLNPKHKGKKPKSIYELVNYPKEDVDRVISELSLKDKAIINKRYSDAKLTREETLYFYSTTISKIRRRLNPKRKNKRIKKDDLTQISNILKSSLFKEIISVLTIEEALIFLLKFGYLNKKEYSNEEIKEILSISDEELNSIIIKLLPAKDNITTFIKDLETKGLKQLKEKYYEK